MKKSYLIILILVLSAVFMSSCVSAADKNETVTEIGVAYRGHVQDYGNCPTDGTWVEDGNMLGTTGESKRIEGFWIKLTGNDQLPAGTSIRYNVHVQNQGWLASTDLNQVSNWIADGDFAGSQGKGQRVEAIQIILLGADGLQLPDYSVVYSVHGQDYGWSQGWKKDGEIAGETGQSRRLESIRIKIINKDEAITDQTPVAEHGMLSVVGTQLTDKNGAAFQIKGVSTHGLSWFPEYVNANAFETMRDEWGINAVRLAMYTTEYNGYCTGDENNRALLKQQVEKGVNLATDLGLYVIIDWHILSDGNPETHQAEAIAFFDEMAERFKDNHNVIYEICNEPNNGTSWNQIKGYAEKVIPVIKAHNQDAVILVGTPTWSQDVDQAAADPISGYSNIMYTLHFYADTHREGLRNKMVAAIEKGLPIFVSEYGICDSSGNGPINEEEASKWMDVLNQYGVSQIAWNLSNKNETSALIRNDCSKTGNWRESELSASGQWLVKMLGKEKELGSGQASNPGDGGNTPPVVENPPDENDSSGNEAAVATVKMTNSWSDGSNYYYQYAITINNQSAVDLNDWKIKLTFPGAITVDQNWNAQMELRDQVVWLSPVDYNQNIPAGKVINDIGCIIYSPQTMGAPMVALE
ncbi:cellulase family glycosylhydrolase [Acetobacterium woodii]|uniref:Endoglucanase n=1 Tax=Acetobacterium woodii (strain ATCC 29683 / DSM 1030 / JCM 2381 / KCTC 1655 / WB1) TaxID=931626 RepID=H6LBS7_ACEWD|nr:cellulase family glycosylhydrolase [Acetobacterium woodii]AFA47670.1 cellulase CelA [Acetobacterium woodii DSM 1030]